jgi:hypothetical protein
MRAAFITWQVRGGWALEIETFLGPVKWHRADRPVPFGTQKSRFLQGTTPLTLALVMDAARIKRNTPVLKNSDSYGSI